MLHEMFRGFSSAQGRGGGLSPARFRPLSLTLSANTLAGEIKRISYVSRGKCTGEREPKRATSKRASEGTPREPSGSFAGASGCYEGDIYQKTYDCLFNLLRHERLELISRLKQIVGLSP